MASPSLATCLINLSEGRRVEVVRAVVAAATKAIQEGARGEAVVLNTFVDREYNRSVVTVAGSCAGLEVAVVAAAREAMGRVDLQRHAGGHPRLGAVDLLPFHPLAVGTSVQACATLARRVAGELVRQVPAAGFFYYGAADELGRSLVSRRRELGWFGGAARGAWDLGEGAPAQGVTGIGAAPYMANFNITLDTQSREVGEVVVRRIRERSGGLLGVSAMAFPHHGATEVACNVDMFLLDQASSRHRAEVAAGRVERVMGGYWRSRPAALEEAVAEAAGREGVAVVGDSVAVGLPLEEARRVALEAMARGEACLPHVCSV